VVVVGATVVVVVGATVVVVVPLLWRTVVVVVGATVVVVVGATVVVVVGAVVVVVGVLWRPDAAVVATLVEGATVVVVEGATAVEEIDGATTVAELMGATEVVVVIVAWCDRILRTAEYLEEVLMAPLAAIFEASELPETARLPVTSTLAALVKISSPLASRADGFTVVAAAAA
jgi:hypothetical protein